MSRRGSEDEMEARLECDLAATRHAQGESDDVLGEDMEPLTIYDVHVVLAEIKKVWLLGDREIMAEAERALKRVLQAAARRFHKRIATPNESVSG